MSPISTSIRNMARKGTLIAATAGLALLLSAPLTVSQAASCANGSIAQRAGKAFVSAARSKSSSAFASALRTHTNMRSISLFALGKYRKKLPKSSERQFVKLTSSYVAKTLASFSKKFRASSVETVRCRGGTVESKLNQLGGRPPQKVLWRIKGGRISDVNVQNVWLAQLLRSNFSSIMKKGGGKMSALFAHLGASPSDAKRLDTR